MAKSDDRRAAAEAAQVKQQNTREQRLAKALRDNLRRRKAPAPANPADSDDQ